MPNTGAVNKNKTLINYRFNLPFWITTFATLSKKIAAKDKSQNNGYKQLFQEDTKINKKTTKNWANNIELTNPWFLTIKQL